MYSSITCTLDRAIIRVEHVVTNWCVIGFPAGITITYTKEQCCRGITVGLFSNKNYSKVAFKCINFGHHFSFDRYSHLLSATVLNDS